MLFRGPEKQNKNKEFQTGALMTRFQADEPQIAFKCSTIGDNRLKLALIFDFSLLQCVRGWANSYGSVRIQAQNKEKEPLENMQALKNPQNMSIPVVPTVANSPFRAQHLETKSEKSLPKPSGYGGPKRLKRAEKLLKKCQTGFILAHF